MPRLTVKELRALKLFKRQLRRELPGGVDTLKLFGSKARGGAAKHSDVDVLVIVSSGGGTLATRRPAYQIASDVLLETGVDISPKVFTQAQYRRLRSWGEPLLLNIEREGIPL